MNRWIRSLSFGMMFGMLTLSGWAGEAATPVPARLDHRAAKMEAALLTSIGKPATYRCLRIDIRGFLGKELRSLSVYGRGFGVWNRERQFDLSTEQIRSCLKALERFHFTSMPDRIGSGKPEGSASHHKERRMEHHGENVTQLIRSVTLTVAGMTKTVEQDNKAPESEAFRKMVAAIVAICRPAAAKGVTAKNLHDGLAKIAAGTLRPELLRVIVNAPELRSLRSQEGQGWKLKIGYARLTAQKWTLQKGPGAPAQKWLSDQEIRSLAQILATSHAASLPGNLNLSGYLQFSVSVLNRNRTIMARRYATRPAPSSSDLEAFTTIRTALFKLFDTVVTPRSRTRPGSGTSKP